MAEADNILTKLHDLLLYVIPQLGRFPREQKFVLGDRISRRARSAAFQAAFPGRHPTTLAEPVGNRRSDRLERNRRPRRPRSAGF